MSPLWPEQALAEAGWANAVERGLVDEDRPALWPRRPMKLDRVRRIRRSPVHSFAL